MTRQLWILLSLLALLSVTKASTALPGPPGARMEYGSGQCSWAALTGEAMLSRRIGAVAVAGSSLASDLMRLLHSRTVPISFLEADKDSRITLQMSDPTLREVLDAVVTQAPAYRYAFVRGHLVFYPRASPFELSLVGFSLAPTPRLDAAYRLVTELRKRDPIFAKLDAPILTGFSTQGFLFDDSVAVSGAATVLDGLVQILGNRPSAVFEVRLTRWPGREPEPGQRFLDLDSVFVVQAIVVRPVETSLRVGETVQLQVTATLAGGSQVVTPGVCGTWYENVNPKVVAVDENGLVKALTPGAAEIVVHNELQASALSFKVTSGTAAKGMPKTAAPQGPP
jgi:hypothetical protein